MILWRKGKLVHIVVFGLLGLYLLLANTFYTTFILKNGKPLQSPIQIPSESEDFSFAFSNMGQVRYDGQDLYALQGYALHSSLPPGEYSVQVILRSRTKDLHFQADRAAFPDALRKRSDYNRRMDPAEFRMLLSKNVLTLGKYQVGILLIDVQGQPLAFQMTGSWIERTAKALRFIPSP